MSHPRVRCDRHDTFALSRQEATTFKPDGSLPQFGQIVVNIVATVDAVVNAAGTGFSALCVLTGQAAARIVRPMNGLDPICGISREIIG
jgi:hypothetical protein